MSDITYTHTSNTRIPASRGVARIGYQLAQVAFLAIDVQGVAASHSDALVGRQRGTVAEYQVHGAVDGDALADGDVAVTYKPRGSVHSDHSAPCRAVAKHLEYRAGLFRLVLVDIRHSAEAAAVRNQETQVALVGFGRREGNGLGIYFAVAVCHAESLLTRQLGWCDEIAAEAGHACRRTGAGRLRVVGGVGKEVADAVERHGGCGARRNVLGVDSPREGVAIAAQDHVVAAF